MSAHLFNDETVNAVLNFVHRHSSSCYGISEIIPYEWYHDFNRDLPMAKILQMLGQRIVDYNYKSVNARYRDEYGDPEKFTLELSTSKYDHSIPQVLKLIEYMDYQCCEPEDYYTDDQSIYKLFQCLIKFTYRRLEGYESAKWGL